MTQIKESADRKKPRVGKQDWLNAALELLRAGGIEAVRVERLAAEFGIAKSGFYYHFRDREDLKDALLAHWLNLDGTPFVEERKLAEAGPAERLRIVAEVVDRNDLSRYDAAIRLWAQQDPKVRRAWRKEVKKRTAHIRGLMAAAGFEGDDLEMRTRLYVAYQVVERDLFADLTAKERRRLRDLRLDFLLAR